MSSPEEQPRAQGARGARRVAIAVLLLVASVVLYYHYRYPYGRSHCCDKALMFALMEYADAHEGWFPRGGKTPEASFSLLYQQNTALASALAGKTVAADEATRLLEAGELLTPATCDWHYVEGLRKDDDSQLALLWDKKGLGHTGQRLSGGGHYVVFVGGAIEYVNGDEWTAFVQRQAQLLTGLKREGQ